LWGCFKIVFRIENINNRDLIETTNPNNGLLEPANILVTAGVGAGKCLEKNSLVTMADGTTKKICEIRAGERVITFNIEIGKSEISRVVQSEFVGIKKGYKLNLLGGATIITSKDHKFVKVNKVKKGKYPKREYIIDNYSWTPLEKIKRMDLIATPKRYERATYDIYDSKIYELIGYLIGDGGIKYEVMITCEKQEVFDKIQSLLPSNMQIKRKNNTKYDCGIICRQRMATGHGIDAPKHFNPIKEILSDLGLFGTGSRTKFIPNNILCASNSNLYNLLSGLIVTDGWIDKKGIGYATSSDQLKDDFCTLLKNLGISHSFHRKKVKYHGRIMLSWQFGINNIHNMWEIYRNCDLLHKSSKLESLLNSKTKQPTHKGINKKYLVGDMEFYRVVSIEELNQIEMWDIEVENNSHNYIANNIIVHNTMNAEQIVNLYYRNGYTVISLSDVKDGVEFGFSMFRPTAPYHLAKLNQFGCPIETIPTKIYHPFSFDLPKNEKLPDFNIYTLNIKTIGRNDIGFLAETKENKRSIQILLDTIQKLGKEEGIHHLIFKAEEQTESLANLTKGTIKYRSDNPDDFFTRTKIGTEKTSGEMNAYFKPFIHNYAITPSDCPLNINIKEIMNDQKHYHIFTTKWIKDRRLKAFFIIHLLTQILENETFAKFPICIYLEEIRFLTPNDNEGFTSFLAEELKNTMTRMRNMGKGYAIVSTTQVYRDVHTSVLDSFNENIFGKISSLKELEFIGKALKLPTQDVNLIKSLEIGEFIIRAKASYEDDASLQKVKMYLPPHAHKEGRYSFFEFYEHHYPELMRTFQKEHQIIQAIKDRVIQSTSELKEKENIHKKAVAQEEKEKKAENYTKYVEELRKKIQSEKDNKVKEKSEALNDKIKELIYAEWKTATGRDKSTRNLAKKFKIFMSNGEPNSMAVHRAITQMRKKYETPETTDEENKDEDEIEKDTQDQYDETPEKEDA
jgi:hypothetical protein